MLMLAVSLKTLLNCRCYTYDTIAQIENLPKLALQSVIQEGNALQKLVCLVCNLYLHMKNYEEITNIKKTVIVIS